MSLYRNDYRRTEKQNLFRMFNLNLAIFGLDFGQWRFDGQNAILGERGFQIVEFDIFR